MQKQTKGIAKTVVIVLLLSLLAAHDQTKSSCTLFEASSQDDFLSYKVENRFVVGVLANFETISDERLEKFRIQLRAINLDENLNTMPVMTVIANIATIPSLAEIYKSTDPNSVQCLLFIHNQLTDLSDWSEAIEQTNDPFILAQAVQQRFEQILISPTDLAHLVTLSRPQITTIFIGQNPDNFQIFKELAYSHIDSRFLLCSNPDLKRSLFQYLGIFYDAEEAIDKVLLIRPDTQITDMDPRTAGYLEIPFDKLSLGTFFEFERYPKLRKNVLQQEHVVKLYHKRQVMLLLVLDPLEGESIRLEREFAQAVKILPRRLIYAVTDIHDGGSGPYHSIANHAETFLQPNSAYIVYVRGLQPRFVQLPAHQLNKDGFIDFAFAFYDNNKHLFDHSHAHKKPGWSDEPDNGFINEEL